MNEETPTSLRDTDGKVAFVAAPIRRAAEPREIAEAIAFLASERASFIVGSIVMVDGGMSVIVQ